MRCAAVVVAAGRGARFGDPLNKVLHPLGGRPLLEHGLEALAASPAIDRIVLVASASDLSRLESLASRLGAGKVSRVVPGGARRIDSVLAGVRACDAAARCVAVHDAARPLVRPETVTAAVEAAERTGGAVVAVPALDTVKRSEDGLRVGSTIPRGEVFLAQTPQVFRREPFLRALEEAVASGIDLTDDASVAERAGIPVEIVAGDVENLKVTRPEDLARAEAILARRGGARTPSFRVGTGFDVHRMAEGRRCVLGGVTIEGARGPVGHSDGDALLHAVADALLGAAGLDDLGTLFSDRDPAHRDADSREILRKCVARVREAGFVVENADCVLVLEAPRIAPHRAAMRAALAEILGVAATCVNVKGKTAEGLGAVGAGEAVVAQATVLLRCVAP